MQIKDLAKRFSTTRENQSKGIFSSLFIVGNQLQTIFDSSISDITLKQFMLLTMVKQSKQQLTFTQMGELLGCSRQNIKKLALSLQKHGYVHIQQSENDPRASTILPTEKMHVFFNEVFLSHQKKLQVLFKDYSDEELQNFYHFMMKLYDGIDHLKRSEDEI